MTLNSSRENICQSFQKQTAKRLSILKVIRVKMMNLCPQPIFTANRLSHSPSNSNDTSQSMNSFISLLTALSTIAKATSQNVSRQIFTSSSGSRNIRYGVASIRGQKVPPRLLSLSFSLTRQPVKIGLKKSACISMI